MILFAFFGMWETLVVGAGAVSIPIIIHLLNRRRFRVVTWAAMKFLLAAQKQNTRKMRLEQLILLAVRTLTILLIVLAMASVMNWAEDVWGYFWPDGAGFVKVRTGRTHKVVVLDGSLSMNLEGQANKTSFDKAKTLAADLVRRAQSGDGFSVVLMKDAPVWVVAEPSQDARAVAAEIELLRPAQGNAAVDATLNMVASKLAETAGRYQRREVYFFTDLQKATWQTGSAGVRPIDDAKDKQAKSAGENSSLKNIQKQATTIFVDVGREAGNLAVSDVRLGSSLVTTGALIPVSATVQNFSPEPVQNVRVELLVGRARETANDSSYSPKPAAQVLLDLKANEQSTVNFAARFAAAGVYAVQVRVQPDNLKADDGRTVIVTVKETVPVMLVNGKPAVDAFDQATEYLRLALNPFPKGATPTLAPLRPDVKTVAQFADPNEGSLSGVDCVFLCDVKRLGTGELRRLETHLRSGGGVVISVGDHFADNLEEHNKVLYKDGRGLLPAKLVKRIEPPDEHFFHLYATDEAFREPPLKEFADSDDRVGLTSARFRTHLQVDPPKDVQAKTILTFMPDIEPLSKTPLDKNLPTKDAALIAWNPPIFEGEPAKGLKKEQAKKPARRYRGNVLLLTTTLNTDWHSWPGSPSYAAMMQELVRYAVAGRLREQSSIVGEVIEAVLPSQGNELNVTLQFPDESGRQAEKSRTKLAEDVNLFQSNDSDWSGVYRLRVQGEPQEHLFAVNVPSSTPDQRGSESDLSRLDAEKLKELYPDWEFQVVDHPRNARIAQRTDEVQVVRGKLGPAIAHYLLIAVLVLLFAEIILAWGFGHHSAVAGATEPPKAGPWPALIAGVSALVFVLGASVLVHASYTGDFLSFLPDGMRRGIERTMEIQPPAPGEGTRWQLEFQAVVGDSGNDVWWAVGLTLAAAVLLFFVYRAESDRVSAAYKTVLAGLRLFIILLALAVLLPQLQLRFDRQSWPNVVLIVDDSRSMGEPDFYRDERIRTAVAGLGKQIQEQLKQRLPEKIKSLNDKIAQKTPAAAIDETTRLEIERLTADVRTLNAELAQLGSPNWQPTRLQVAQGIIGQADQDWFDFLLNKRHMKVNVFHLDAAGRAIRFSDSQGKAGEITHPDDVESLKRAQKAAAELQPSGDDSRLGSAVRQVLDYYKGGSLAAVIMLSDGVTTRDESISQVSSYAKLRGVPLFFVGIGDDQEIRDLKLHDLQVEDTVYVGDRVIFQARLTGEGYKDPVAVVLKEKQKDGTEKEVDRTIIKLTPQNKSERVLLRHRPNEAGRKMFIIEVIEPEAADPKQKPEHAGSARLEREIDVLESKLIKVLYVEQFPRYEFRFVKSLLERESDDAQNKRSVDLKVVLLDADPDFPAQDKTALPDFPATRQELDQYDVVILGDVDPHGQRMGDQRLRMLADFVRGEDESGKKLRKTGGGLLMLAGPNFNPHGYRNTPLAAVLPIEPNAQPPVEPEELLEEDKFQLQMTAVGREHPVFRFSPNDAENQKIWEGLSGMFWHARGYRIKPLAEVLAVHPDQKADAKIGGQDPRHPLVVQQFVGSGRTMFFGFEESWRWRLREDEVRFNQFWIQTVRYLSRTRLSRTVLRLDRQTPYRLGEPIKVTVRFPDNVPLPDSKQKDDQFAPKGDVTVIVEHRPPGSDKGEADSEIQTMKLAKMEGSWGTFEGLLKRTREGKYRFWLSTPDVSKEDPNGQKPGAEARVEMPPGELDRLRMDQHEMLEASKATQGGFYTVDVANQLLEDLPSGFRISLNTPRPPWLMWNHALMFLLVLGLLSSEWLLRKRKHLL